MLLVKIPTVVHILLKKTLLLFLEFYVLYRIDFKLSPVKSDALTRNSRTVTTKVHSFCFFEYEPVNAMNTFG